MDSSFQMFENENTEIFNEQPTDDIPALPELLDETYYKNAIAIGEDVGLGYTTSVKIAEVHQKRHFNIMRTINNIIQANPNAKGFFKPCTYVDSRNRVNDAYQVTASGYMLLASTFTDEESKEKMVYLGLAFQMQQRQKLLDLHQEAAVAAQQHKFQFDTEEDMYKAAFLNLYKEREETQQQVAQLETQVTSMKPKEEFYDVFQGSEELTKVGDFAVLLRTSLKSKNLEKWGMNRQQVFEYFVKKKYMYKQGGRYCIGASVADKGWFRYDYKEGNNGKVHKTAKLTPAGVEHFLMKFTQEAQEQYQQFYQAVTDVVSKQQPECVLTDDEMDKVLRDVEKEL